MRFWDSSAVVPLVVAEPESRELARLAREDPAIVVWWGTPVECASAVARLARDGGLTARDERTALDLLGVLTDAWSEVLPTAPLRAAALRLLRVHPLQAGDALQLAAALTWAHGSPDRHDLVTRDERLAAAARKEGFGVL